MKNALPTKEDFAFWLFLNQNEKYLGKPLQKRGCVLCKFLEAKYPHKLISVVKHWVSIGHDTVPTPLWMKEVIATMDDNFFPDENISAKDMIALLGWEAVMMQIEATVTFSQPLKF